MTLRTVSVFCGSQVGRLPEYEQAARELARVLVAHDVELVYGGGHVGLMGALADAMLTAGGRVTGVIPRHLMRPEVPRAAGVAADVRPRANRGSPGSRTARAENVERSSARAEDAHES